jgi:hypothetical protein
MHLVFDAEVDVVVMRQQQGSNSRIRKMVTHYVETFTLPISPPFNAHHQHILSPQDIATRIHAPVANLLRTHHLTAPRGAKPNFTDRVLTTAATQWASLGSEAQRLAEANHCLRKAAPATHSLPNMGPDQHPAC